MCFGKELLRKCIIKNEESVMKELRFVDIKKLDYNDDMPFKYVLVDLLY